MLEEARVSLEQYLRDNRKLLEENTTNISLLRKTWLMNNPKYEDYDLQLDIKWTGERGGKRYVCYCCITKEELESTIPRAKDFVVETIDENYYKAIKSVKNRNKDLDYII